MVFPPVVAIVVVLAEARPRMMAETAAVGSVMLLLYVCKGYEKSEHDSVGR
jgi:hypothetical protein